MEKEKETVVQVKDEAVDEAMDAYVDQHRNVSVEHFVKPVKMPDVHLPLQNLHRHL